MASPLYAARRVRRALARRAEADARLDGELNIVPFLDIVTNLLLFLLATTASVMVVAQVDAQLRDTSRRGARGAPPTVSVTLAASGIVVAGPGGYVSVGCDHTSRALATAVPRRDGRYDWAALSACMERVRDAGSTGDQVIVTADPTVPYEDVLHAMDAVRARGDRPLFGEVLLSAGVR
ncbi:MAG: biopolymer transporter ExbD [Myxococcota bacterium]|nr:biopolymer transporter ExbD [Myxococcota bacterium]